MNPRGIAHFRRHASLPAVLALVLVAALAAASGAGGAPPGTECIDKAQRLTGPSYDQGEPSVKASQRDPRRLLAVWTDGTPNAGTQSPLWSGGRIVLSQRGPTGEWSQEMLTASGADSWIDTAPNGAAYASYMWKEAPFGTFVRRVMPGQPAGPALEAPLFLDHPAVAVDQRLRRQDSLYLVGGRVVGSLDAVLIMSNDGGTTWLEPVDFPRPLPRVYGQAGPAVASGGDTVVAAWIEPTDEWGEDGATAIRVAPIDHATGEFGKPTTVALMRGGWSLPIGAATIPSISVVRGGRYEGRAYLAWPQRRGRATSDVSDIFVRSSDDGGSTWSPARRANDDEPAAGNYHVLPSVAARRDGSALVAWMDTRDDPTRSTTLMCGAKVNGDSEPGANLKLTRCPSYDAGPGVGGDYFNFDASQERPVMVFPNIRTEGEDSDVFFLEQPQMPAPWGAATR